MQRFILMAGTILAFSLGFALAGFILNEAIRNSRRRPIGKKDYRGQLRAPQTLQYSVLGDPACRGYDTPELHREDSLARTKKPGNDRDYQ
jgi:hypothetical protein